MKMVFSKDVMRTPVVLVAGQGDTDWATGPEAADGEVS
jgi:hypothetical protein